MVEETEVLLPQSVEELETFIEELTKEFNLPPGDETAYSISNMICHLPVTAARAKRTYFADGVLRGVAQKAAYRKTEETRKRLIAADEAAKAEQEKKTELTLVTEESAPVGADTVQGA